MVNQDIVRYLEEGKRRGFSVQLLKQKLIEGGFAEADVDEAIMAIGGGQRQPEKIDLFDKSKDSLYKPRIEDNTQTQFKGIQQKPEVKFETRPGTQMNPAVGGKWIKIGAIIGIFILLLGLAAVVLNLAFGGLVEDLLQNGLALSVLSIIVVLMLILYYYALTKVGVKTNQKFLVLGSWFTVISLIAYLVLGVIANLFLHEPAMNFLSEGDSEGLYKVTFLILSILWVVSLALHVVGMILVAIGMIKAREIKMLKIAGIINLIVVLCGVGFLIGMIMFIYAVLNVLSVPDPSFNGLDSLVGDAMPAVIALLAMFAIKQLARVFEIIGLFNASAKYE